MLSINEEVKAYKDGMKVDNDEIAAEGKPIVADTLGIIYDHKNEKEKDNPIKKIIPKLKRLRLGFKN